MMANNKIKGSYPLRVEEIVFSDGSTLKDKVVLLCGDFVIVDVDDGAPTMYNVNTISELRRVEEQRPQPKPMMTVW